MQIDLKALLIKLLEHEIDFVLVGGFASMVHGSPVVTQDLDICLRIDEEQVRKLRVALKDLSPRHRMNPTFKPSFLEFPDTLAGVENIYLETDIGILDAMSELRPVGGFERVKAKAIKVSLYGFQCPVISLEDLIAIKETMTRPKDKEAVLYLREILRKTRDNHPCPKKT